MIDAEYELELHYDKKDILPKKLWVNPKIPIISQYESGEFGFWKNGDRIQIEWSTGHVEVDGRDFYRALLQYYLNPIRFFLMGFRISYYKWRNKKDCKH